MELEKTKKYIGNCCGNNFIIVDCRNLLISKAEKSNFALKTIPEYEVDSALFINNEEDFDLSVEIFEKDGSESDSCGNGIILIAYLFNLSKGKVKMKNGVFVIEGNLEKQSISMNMEVSLIKEFPNQKNCLFVRMGEPHIIYLVDNVSEFDLIKIGKEIQKSYPDGVNVDVISKNNDFCYSIRTYERGVFDETKSCGTGSLSSYVAISRFYDKMYEVPIEFKSRGGSHWVSQNGNILKLETLKKFCEVKPLN